MKKVLLLALTLLAISAQGATFTFSRTNIKINNLSDVNLKDIKASYGIECRYQDFYDVGSCGENVSNHEITERDSEGNLILPEIHYVYKRGHERHISITLHLKAKDEVVVFNADIKGLQAKTKNYKKLFSEVTLFSLLPDTSLTTTIDGMPVEKWLEMYQVPSLDLLMWVTPKSGGSLVLHDSIYKNTQILNGPVRLVGFSGAPTETSTLSVDISVSSGNKYMGRIQKTVPLSRELPEALRRLNLSSETN